MLGSAPGFVAGQEVPIHLPADYTAFCSTHRRVYLRYSRVRLRCEAAAQRAVACALGDLAMTWSAALRSPSLPAVAWSTLTGRVAACARDRDLLRRLLPDQQADAVILRHRLGLGVPDVAQTMGLPQPVIISQLRCARRALQYSAIAR